MRPALTAIIICVILASCRDRKQVAEQRTTITDSAKGKFETIKTDGTSWADSVVMYYTDHAENEQIKAARKDTLGWMLDQTLQTDTATYLVFHIGHNFEDRFVTDGWLYIDSATRRTYEYDVPDDQLNAWPK